MNTAHEYDHPLYLTTPLVADLADEYRVRDAQWLLAGHNRFPGLAPYKDGLLDDTYGPQTAQATARAKYWLGYSEKAVNQVFGQTLYEYLRPHDWRPLPLSYRIRRAQRMKAAQNSPGLKGFTEAEKWIGYKEVPRNHTIFGRWYGLDGEPWCAIFESYTLAHSGWKRFHYAYVGYIYDDAKAQRNGLRLVYTPRRGDLVGYRLHGDPYAHTAYFDHWIDSNTFMDLGGNTGPSSISNGGMVVRQQRERSMVSFFARVG